MPRICLFSCLTHVTGVPMPRSYTAIHSVAVTRYIVKWQRKVYGSRALSNLNVNLSNVKN